MQNREKLTLTRRTTICFICKGLIEGHEHSEVRFEGKAAWLTRSLEILSPWDKKPENEPLDRCG
jgi:hypothetical protein